MKEIENEIKQNKNEMKRTDYEMLRNEAEWNEMKQNIVKCK